MVAKSKTPAKRARKAEARRVMNASRKSAMKTAIKKFESHVADNNIEQARTSFINAVSLIDRNSARGVIHKNKAARKKSRLAKKLNKLVQE